jgi:uncharacterized protein YaeQ
MALPSTLFRFRIELAHIERGVYEKLDVRLAMHPSESTPYLLTRVLAYALNWQDGLEFSRQGLADPEGPAILVNHANGRISLWIEIGNPSARKLHKATKAAAEVKIYTYKDPQLILREVKAADIHKGSEIQIFSFDPKFLEKLGTDLTKSVSWNILYNDKVLTVNDEQTELGEFKLN